MKNTNSIALLLLLSSCLSTEADSLNCTNKAVSDCKKEFIGVLEESLKEFQLNTVKTDILDTIDVFNAVLEELKPNDPYAEMLHTAITKLNTDLQELLRSHDNYEEIRNITNRIEYDVQPHIMQVNPNKKALLEFEELIDKHNYTKKLESKDFEEFHRVLCKAWTKLFAALRPVDLEVYTAYSDINDDVNALINAEDKVTKDKLLKDIINKIRNFMEVPFFEEL